MTGRGRLAIGTALVAVLLGGAALTQLGSDADPDARPARSAGIQEPLVDPSADATGPVPTYTPPDPGNRPGPESTGTLSDDLSQHDAGTFRQDGMVLQDVVITGDVRLTGANQTLRNVRVQGQVRVTGSGVVIEDSELGSLVLSGASAFTGRGLEIFGNPGDDGIHISSDTGPVQDVVIEDSWLHSPALNPDSHYDGIQVRGVQGLVLRNLFLDLGPFDERHATAVFLQDANGGNSGVLIENSWIDGGAFALNLSGTDITVRGNVFGPNAEYGLLYPTEQQLTLDGNILDTGAPADL